MYSEILTYALCTTIMIITQRKQRQKRNNTNYIHHKYKA